MDNPDFKRFLPPQQTPQKLTIRALIVSVVMAAVLGAANVYLGRRAGQSVAAATPLGAVVTLTADYGYRDHLGMTSRARQFSDPNSHYQEEPLWRKLRAQVVE